MSSDIKYNIFLTDWEIMIRHKPINVMSLNSFSDHLKFCVLMVNRNDSIEASIPYLAKA